MANVGTDYNSSHPDSLLPPVKSTGYRLDTTQPGLFHVVTSYSPGQLLSQQIMRPPRLLTDIFNRANFAAGKSVVKEIIHLMNNQR